jgi:hypothetical protein
VSGAEHPYRFWLPTLISVVALVMTVLQAIDSREAREQAATPLVDFFTQDDENERTMGVSIKNNGPGVAQVKAMKYYVDGKLLAGLDEAIAAAQVTMSRPHQFQLEPGDSLAVGENIDLIKFQFRDKDKQAATKFSDFLDNHLGIEIEYSSIGGSTSSKRCSTEPLCKNASQGRSTDRTQ